METNTGSHDAREATGGGTESVRRASLIAGTALLAVAILAGFGSIVVVDGLLVPGSAARTATNVRNSTGLLRVGIASLLAVAILDVVVAWALYTVFEPESRRLSTLAAWFRLAYAGIFAVAIAHLLLALRTLTDPTYSTVYTTQQRHTLVLAQLETFGDIWTAGLAVFAVHLLLLGYLTYSASYTPNYLAVLLGIGGLGYLVDSLGAILVSGYSIEVSAVTFVGEVVLIGWLLVKGRTVDLRTGPQASRK